MGLKENIESFIKDRRTDKVYIFNISKMDKYDLNYDEGVEKYSIEYALHPYIEDAKCNYSVRSIKSISEESLIRALRDYRLDQILKK